MAPGGDVDPALLSATPRLFGTLGKELAAGAVEGAGEVITEPAAGRYRSQLCGD